MKTMTLALGLAILLTGVAQKVLESPELLPQSFWDHVHVPIMTDDSAWPDGMRSESLYAQRQRTTRTLSASVTSTAPSASLGLITLAQAPAPAPAPAAPPAPSAPAAPEAAPDAPTPPTANNVSTIEENLKSAQQQAERAQEQAARALEQADREFQRTYSYSVGNPFGMHGTAAAEGRSLVIRFSEIDPKSLANSEEDLNVMGRILAKALAKAGESEDAKAMGIHITSFGSGAKNLLIEGFGALFLLNVDFPLAGPPEKPETEKTTEPTNSTWEEAKRELYGVRAPRRGWQAAAPMTPQIEYDPKRVEELKDSLLEALKNASNIRSLKEGDFVTVVVTSGDRGGSRLYRNKALIEQGAAATYELATISDDDDARPKAQPRTASTLTMRAKKADIDAFFKGKLSLDDFRKHVTMTLY